MIMQKYSKLNRLRFLINSGITEFMQDIPRSRYNNNSQENTSKVSSEKLDLRDVKNLDQLQNYVNNFNSCKLKLQAKKTVFSDGKPSSKIMLIGEAPGAEEDKIGKPFVGLAGKLLDKMLESIDLNRDKVYISNIVPWRPPGNRQPNDEEIMQCLPIIQKHIEIINPMILVLLGNTAAKSILTSTIGITKLRGKWYEYNNPYLKKPILTRAMFHPAFLLRTPSYKKDAWSDLLEIKKKIN